MVPFHRSALAHFISKYDIWYQRNVHAVFKEPRILPQNDHYIKERGNFMRKRKKENEELPTMDISDKNLPNSLMDKCFQNYMNYADKHF